MTEKFEQTAGAGDRTLLTALMEFYAEQVAAADDHRTKLAEALESNPARTEAPAALYDRGRVAGEKTVLDAFAAFVMTCAAEANGGLTVERIAEQQEAQDQ